MSIISYDEVIRMMEDEYTKGLKLDAFVSPPSPEDMERLERAIGAEDSNVIPMFGDAHVG